MSDKHSTKEMPILNLNLGNTSRFEASRFLDTPETIRAFLAESMKANDPEVLMQAVAEVAKAKGVNKLAQDAGVNRESLYKALKGGTHTRYDTVMRLLLAVGVELTVKIADGVEASKPAPSRVASKASSRSAAKVRSAAGKVAAPAKAAAKAAVRHTSPDSPPTKPAAKKRVDTRASA